MFDDARWGDDRRDPRNDDVRERHDDPRQLGRGPTSERNDDHHDTNPATETTNAGRNATAMRGTEMVGLSDDIERALAGLERVVESVSDSESRLYYRHLAQTPVGPRHLCVVVKVRTDDAFAITAYLTDKVKKGRVLWPTAM